MPNPNFPAFAAAVHSRLTDLSTHELFEVDATDLFASYLAAFPAGTDPIFRVNTEHTCSCCRNFIKGMGHLVAIVDGRKQTLWDIPNLPAPYDAVAAKLNEIILQLPIKGVFRTNERRYGAEVTYELMEGHSHPWHHFHGDVKAKHHSVAPGTARGTIDTAAQVFKRGLEELRPDALTTILDLIDSNSLYRGAEHRAAVAEFAALQSRYVEFGRSELLVWSQLDSFAARFRNTAIGTLAVDLSEGMDLDRAVRAFESKVAPTNYKRTSALITPKMIDSALATLAELGLSQAVERRFARLDDIKVPDVLFVDNAARPLMQGADLRSALLSSVRPTAGKPIEGQKIGIEEFLSSILPEAKQLEILPKARHLGNFVSLTAPAHPDTGRLFKWANDFAWSYDGEVADSIKARVKRAGGNTGAALRVSLAWNNTDDLDLHAQCPDGRVYYGNKLGILDVDMNVREFNASTDPVENLSWSHPKNGTYEIRVNQFCQRNTDNVGFTLEIECNGAVQQFTYPRLVKSTIPCLKFRMEGGKVVDLKADPSLIGGEAVTLKWGITTGSFIPVVTLMNSPNHWVGAGAIGQKHWFFMLRDCVNPDPTRGFYNEFLSSALDPHRKVFEVLGNKTKCPPQADQLSGLGFTAGREDEITVRVNNARVYTIGF